MPITKKRLSRRVPLIAAFAALALCLWAPQALARYVYTGNYSSGTVSVIDTATNQIVGAPIPLEITSDLASMAVTPNGKTLYVANYSGSIAVIDTQTNQPIGSIPLEGSPNTIAISPDGKTAYVTEAEDVVVVVDTASNQIVGTPIPVGEDPYGIALSPDGKTAYVTSQEENSVSVIDTATRQVVGAPIPVGEEPWGLALTPDGKKLYVSSEEDNTVTVIDTATRQVVGAPILVGNDPYELAVTPDGKTLYVTNYEGGGTAGSVSVINTQTDQVSTTIPVTGGPWQLAIAPDQSPLPSFTYAASKKQPLNLFFSGLGSTDPDGTVASYNWSFGDGTFALHGGPTPIHKYAKAGVYSVSLTAVDNEGCSGFVFTGRTAHCNGPGPLTQAVTVKAPNNFKFGKLKRNTSRGTAKLTIRVPAAGKLILSGKKVKRAQRSAKKAGKVTLNIRPKPKAKKQLAQDGSAKVRIKVKFRPIGGAPKTKSKTVKLVQN